MSAEGGPPSTPLAAMNLALRALMELGVVLALGDWGYHAGATTPTRVLLMVAAPLVGFGFWGLVDFRGAGRAGEVFRLVQELLVSGVAACAWYVSGRHALGWALGAVSVVHHVLVYAAGERLLKSTARRSSSRAPASGSWEGR